MNNINTRLAEVRAKALLTVHLTARDDLAVEEVANASGYDFIIRIIKDGSLTNRMFAAEVKASVRDADLPRVQLPAQQLLYYKDIPFPVCLFFFLMSNDRGYYRWLVEPTVSSGQPGLSFHVDEQALGSKGRQFITFRPEEFSELNLESLERVVNSVNAWYDARSSPK